MPCAAKLAPIRGRCAQPTDSAAGERREATFGWYRADLPRKASRPDAFLLVYVQLLGGTGRLRAGADELGYATNCNTMVVAMTAALETIWGPSHGCAGICCETRSRITCPDPRSW